jgi:hypothetical protein
MNDTDSSITRIESLPLHDATLESASLDCKSGELRLVLDTTADETMAVLAFSQTTRFNATREQPWGPSVSVNEARTLPSGAIEVELQSGDIWSIHAASWSISYPLRSEA